MTQKQEIQLAIPPFLAAMAGDYLMGINSIGTTSGGEMVWNVISDLRLVVSSLFGAVFRCLFWCRLRLRIARLDLDVCGTRKQINKIAYNKS